MGIGLGFAFGKVSDHFQYDGVMLMRGAVLIALVLLGMQPTLFTAASIRLSHNVFAYIGQPQDEALPLLAVGGYRSYDPQLGRFLKQDSALPFQSRATFNGYDYAEGNPIDFVDPDGHMPFLFYLALAPIGLPIITSALHGLAFLTISSFVYVHDTLVAIRRAPEQIRNWISMVQSIKDNIDNMDEGGSFLSGELSREDSRLRNFSTPGMWKFYNADDSYEPLYNGVTGLASSYIRSMLNRYFAAEPWLQNVANIRLNGDLQQRVWESQDARVSTIDYVYSSQQVDEVVNILREQVLLEKEENSERIKALMDAVGLNRTYPELADNLRPFLAV